MPYGRRADWVRNVLAAGSAELVHQGRTSTLVEPRVVPTSEVVGSLPPGEQRTLRLFGVDECLRAHVSDGGA
jgi:hypothetical protein